MFLKSYLLKRGFLDGLHGLVLAVLHANAAFLKRAKLWDLRRASRPAPQPDAPAVTPPR